MEGAWDRVGSHKLEASQSEDGRMVDSPKVVASQSEESTQVVAGKLEECTAVASQMEVCKVVASPLVVESQPEAYKKEVLNGRIRGWWLLYWRLTHRWFLMLGLVNWWLFYWR